MPTMRTVRISNEVYDEIAKRGKFDETVEDVLRRVFKLDPATHSTGVPRGRRRGRGRVRHATKRMSARVEDGLLFVWFEDGERNQWRLPDSSNKAEIRKIRDEAVQFALGQGATDPGQTNAVRKALTDSGYHLIR